MSEDCARAVKSKPLPANTAQSRAARSTPVPRRDQPNVLTRSPSG